MLLAISDTKFKLRKDSRVSKDEKETAGVKDTVNSVAREGIYIAYPFVRWRFLFQFDGGGACFQRREANADFDVSKNMRLQRRQKARYFEEAVKRESFSSVGNRFHARHGGTENALLRIIRLALYD